MATAERNQQPDPPDRTRAALVEAAASRAQATAYDLHRQRVRHRIGAPARASRGLAGWLALALLVLGLLLIPVHPVPSIATLTLAAGLWLTGTTRLEAGRRALAAADAEAQRSWRGTHQGSDPAAASAPADSPNVTSPPTQP